MDNFWQMRLLLNENKLIVAQSRGGVDRNLFVLRFLFAVCTGVEQLLQSKPN